MNRTALTGSILMHALGVTCAIALGVSRHASPDLAEVEWQSSEMSLSSKPMPAAEPVIIEQTDADAPLAEPVFAHPRPAKVDEPLIKEELDADPMDWLLMFASLPIVRSEEIDEVEAQTAQAPTIEEPPAATVDAVASAYVDARPVSDNPAPNYPRRARLRGHEGDVILEVSVRADGSVEEVRVFKPAPFPELNREALRAVRVWRFIPATRGREAVASVVRVPVVFQLTDRKE